RQHGNLHRETARLPDAALDLVGPHLEVRVAGIGVAPGIQDRDDWFSRDVLGAESGLLRARPVTEGSKVLAPEPAMAAQVAGRFARSLGAEAPAKAAHRRHTADARIG